MNILVIDDEPDLELLIRQRFRRRIRSQELHFTFAGDGVEALACLAADPAIDILLSDINMPRMDGLTLLDRLGDWPYPLKVIMVSAYGDLANIRTAMNRGAFDFITKPIDFDDLALTLDKTHRELAAHRDAAALKHRMAAFQQELDIARQIQLTSLPCTFPAFPERTEFDLHAVMHPAREVGGDFYDFFLLDDHRLGFAVGDVAGKGLPAALFMSTTRTLLRATALHGMPPEACVRHVNRVLHAERVKGIFVTLLYGILDGRTGEVTYCNAGHNLPYHVARDGEVTACDRARNLAVCLARDFAFHSQSLTLAPGDRFFAYTDGVPEAANPAGTLFEEARMEACLQRLDGAAPEALHEAMGAAVSAFADGAPQRDDVTMLTLQYRG